MLSFSLHGSLQREFIQRVRRGEGFLFYNTCFETLQKQLRLRVPRIVSSGTVFLRRLLPILALEEFRIAQKNIEENDGIAEDT